MVKESIRYFAVILACVLCAAGCAVPKLSRTPEPAVLEVSELPHRVAILPFINRTSDPQAAVTVRKMFYNFFSSLNYLDVEPFTVETTLRRKGLYKKIVSGQRVSPQRLGQILGVDAVIFGEVFSFGKRYALVYTDTRAGLQARMVHCGTGRTVWELEHEAALRKGDVPLSLPSLAKALITSVINYQQAAGMKAATQLCLEMVATIPSPPTITEPPPRIKVLVHNGAEKLIRPGGHLRVVMIGDPGHEASWEISPLVKDLTMEEKEPGTYVGAYQVTPQDRLSHGRVLGHLRSRKKLESHWVDVLGPVRLGEPTLLPSTISEDIVLGPEGSPYLVEEVLLVQPGVRLTVEPGAVFWFRNLGLIIRGEIHARGTPENPIRFAGIGSSDWKGILVEDGGGDHVFSHCVISGAEFGLKIFHAKITMDHCLVQGNVWGLVLDGGSVDISNSQIRTSDRIGLSARNGEVLMRESLISENKSGGILLKASQAHIEHNSILNNGEWELKILEQHGDVVARNNWWGYKEINEIRVIGPAEIDPALDEPIAFEIFEEVNY